MIKTRLTEFFEIEHPIIGAPMAFAAGGRLASAVTNAGGLGLIGGAYGDRGWVDTQFTAAGNAVVGFGFITWNLSAALEASPDLLDAVLDRQPAALFLSFGDPQPYAQTIADAEVPLICQVQTLHDARHAVDCGAAVIVAQGSEAGGHGEARATMTLVPEVADMLAKTAPDVLLCAAGGIADGRGLAASLMLGADGVLVGSRLWASYEADVHPNMHEAARLASGDDTIRSSVMDIARHLDWPDRYTARVLKNAFTDRWHNDIEGLLKNAQAEAAKWRQAWSDGDMDIANTFVGEAAGLIKTVEPAGAIISRMVDEAERQLARY
ncbi:MAG: nitronate monooxygenase [Ahrensia sp.]|nr:nitronate monooxygenase [Ahrensia sp.]